MHTITPQRRQAREGPSEHVSFMRRRLQQASQGWAGGRLSDAEVIATCSGNSFWELLGMRIEGHSGLLMGAARFRRQDERSKYSRQSLPSYLALDRSLAEGMGRLQRPLIHVEVPAANESVPEFLRQLSGKTSRRPVIVDKEHIQLVFDLRAENPSAERGNAAAKRVRQTVVFRTCDGHVISGDLIDLDQKLIRDLPFLALTMGVQHTVHGGIPLPTVCIHRRRISLLSKLDAAEQLGDWLSGYPFALDSANPLHLLLEG